MGGLQKSGLVLVKAMQSAGFSVELCLLYPGKHFFGELDSLTIYTPPAQSKLLVVKWFQVLWHLWSSIRKSSSDQVVVFGRYYGALAGLTLLLNRKVRLIVSERNSPHFRLSSHYERFCDAVFALRSPDLVLAQTDYAAKHQKNRYPSSRLVTLYNVFDSVHGADTILAKGSSVGGDITFLVAGRFNDALKGIPTVLEAFMRLHDARGRLLIAGGKEGEDSSIDKILGANLNTSSRVEFLGKVENMHELFSMCDVFVLPSNSEGFPNVLVEAMQHGLCCITTEFHPGVFEILLDGEEGIVLPTAGVDAMENAFRKVLDGQIDVKRLGENAKKRSKQFEIVERISEIREVFGVS